MGNPVSFEINSATFFAYPFGVLRPVPTAVPPNAISENNLIEFSILLIPFSICFANAENS